MALTISENKKKSVVAYINDHFDKHMSHFPYAKYPTEPLNQWREQFSDPKAVDPKTNRTALSWRGGFWQRKDAPYAQRQTALSVVRLWPEFVREEAAEPAHVFDFWTSRLETIGTHQSASRRVSGSPSPHRQAGRKETQVPRAVRDGRDRPRPVRGTPERPEPEQGARHRAYPPVEANSATIRPNPSPTSSYVPWWAGSTPCSAARRSRSARH